MDIEYIVIFPIIFFKCLLLLGIIGTCGWAQNVAFKDQQQWPTEEMPATSH